jgi:glycosyltransferase involved in cell wall biosynthesis
VTAEAEIVRSQTPKGGDGRATVIVVSYQHAPFVRECLDSIRAQSVPPARVLIADDASGDDTAPVIERFLAAHPGFAEFHPNERNLGLTRTLNRLLKMVESEYVTYISADDLMLPDRLAEHTHLLDATGAALAYSDATVIDRQSATLFSTSRVEFPWPDEPDRSDATFQQLFDTNWIPAASMFLRTEVLREEGGYNEEIFFEDYELLVRLAGRGHQFVYVEHPLVAVRRLDTSLGAIGFSRDDPRFLHASDIALRHFDAAAEDIRQRARSKGWELAKRLAAADVPVGAKWRALAAARSGARSAPAYLFHMARAAGNSTFRHMRARGSSVRQLSP